LDERAWGIARETGHVSAALYAELVARQANRDAWAERALLSRPDYFHRFHAEPETRAKAVRIINTYTRISADLERIVKPLRNPATCPPKLSERRGKPGKPSISVAAARSAMQSVTGGNQKTSRRRRVNTP
jgi:hypothetical protein